MWDLKLTVLTGCDKPQCPYRAFLAYLEFKPYTLTALDIPQSFTWLVNQSELRNADDQSVLSLRFEPPLKPKSWDFE